MNIWEHHSLKKRGLALLLALAMMVGLLPIMPTTAQAADIPGTVPGLTNPEGISIDLFDYWLDGQTEPDDAVEGIVDAGINVGKSLKFGNGMDSITPAEDDPENPDGNKEAVEEAASKGEINKYTNGARPMAGMVKPLLDESGYPRLENFDESLSYLFDASQPDGKAAYLDTKGLLLQDKKEGYYYYDSKKNFASFDDTNDNTFTLYDGSAVNSGGGSGESGQFFPFNTAEQVFGNGDIKSTDSVLNHYFGLHMNAVFQQTPDGLSPIDNKTPVTFSFSGDDDVWIFIDDVLVADLGGIHDACSVEINFATGSVKVFRDDNENGTYDEETEKAHLYSETTLYAAYDYAEKENSTEWSGNTFADETYHSLDFFYLERGNVDSNMNMKFNMRTVPESDLYKVDQDNEAVPNVEFNLYAANENYEPQGEPIATGTTDDTGALTFREPNGKLMRMDKLQADGHYLLKETVPPDGYRKSEEPIRLRAEENHDKIVLLSE